MFGPAPNLDAAHVCGRNASDFAIAAATAAAMAAASTTAAKHRRSRRGNHLHSHGLSVWMHGDGYGFGQVQSDSRLVAFACMVAVVTKYSLFQRHAKPEYDALLLFLGRASLDPHRRIHRICRGSCRLRVRDARPVLGRNAAVNVPAVLAHTKVLVSPHLRKRQPHL